MNLLVCILFVCVCVLFYCIKVYHIYVILFEFQLREFKSIFINKSFFLPFHVLEFRTVYCNLSKYSLNHFDPIILADGCLVFKTLVKVCRRYMMMCFWAHVNWVLDSPLIRTDVVYDN